MKTTKKWYFVIADVVHILTDTPNPTDYIKKMRKRDAQLSEGWGQFVTPLSIETLGGKQILNCANAQGLFNQINTSEEFYISFYRLWHIANRN